jgi:hypothetical protein
MRPCRPPSLRPVRAFVQPGFGRAGFLEQTRPLTQSTQGGETMADAGPPLVVTALGLILWLAVDATLAGISIQTIGIILVLVGVVWLLIELVQWRGRPARRPATVVREEPVVRERDVY